MLNFFSLTIVIAALTLAGCSDSGGGGGDNVDPQINGETSGNTTGSTGTTLGDNISNGPAVNSLNDFWSCRIPVNSGADITYSVAFSNEMSGSYSDSTNEGLGVVWSATDTSVSWTIAGVRSQLQYQNLEFDRALNQYNADMFVDGSFAAAHICTRTSFGTEGSAELASSQFVNGLRDFWGCSNNGFRAAFSLLSDGRGIYADQTLSGAVDISNWTVSGSDLAIRLVIASGAALVNNEFSTANSFTTADISAGATSFGPASCDRLDASGIPIQAVTRGGAEALDPVIQTLVNHLSR